MSIIVGYHILESVVKRNLRQKRDVVNQIKTFGTIIVHVIVDNVQSQNGVYGLRVVPHLTNDKRDAMVFPDDINRCKGTVAPVSCL